MNRSPRLNKQTFIDVAEAIREARDDAARCNAFGDGEAPEPNWRDVAYKIADKFAQRARDFDRDLFLRNAGVES